MKEEVDYLIEKLEALARPNIQVKLVSESSETDGIWYSIDLEDKIHWHCRHFKIHDHLLVKDKLDELANEIVSEAIDYFDSRYYLNYSWIIGS